VSPISQGRGGLKGGHEAAGLRQSVAVKAGEEYRFELSQYVEAKVDHAQVGDNGNIIFLKLMDDDKKVISMYVGQTEAVSLIKEMENKHMPRPLTHDLMKSTLESLGYRVTKACITALVGNTFHGSLHYLKTGNGVSEEVVVDARPSDAINMAARFRAAIFVHKDVAGKLAVPMESYAPRREETKSEIIQSVKRDLLHFNDPTYMHKLQLQLAIEEERYEDATSIRDTIDEIMTTNRELGLIVAMETALHDERYEEAASLRDELRRITAAKQQVQADGQ